MSKLRRLLLLVAAIFVLGGCYSSYDSYSSARRVYFSPSDPSVVKVMTYNIRTNTVLDGLNNWHFRKQRVVSALSNNAADVIGLQEVKYSQLQQIQWGMPQYSYYAVGRSDGVHSGESCPIFYRKDRFLLLDSGTFWFSDSSNVPGTRSWGNILPRICSWVHLRQQGQTSGFYVYNLHLDHLSQNSREHSVRLLAQKVAERKTSDPFVVMGDYNMELYNPAMMYLMKFGYDSPYPKMVDAWLSVHPTSSDTSTRRLVSAQIDHISICQEMIALDATIDNTENGSDHYPVIAKLLITEPKQASDGGGDPIAARSSW